MIEEMNLQPFRPFHLFIYGLFYGLEVTKG